MKHNSCNTEDDGGAADGNQKYRPSMAAIQACMKYSIVELAISLFTFALFINSAILIVCGASLYSVNGAEDADLFGIYNLLDTQVGHAAATVFAIALLLSGCSAGIVCTLAGQMISEGQLAWKLKPWVTRLLTRSISIVPAILVAGTLGKDGLSEALVGSQVALSVILPFVTAPLIYYTCRNKYMHVVTTYRDHASGQEPRQEVVNMRNHWTITALAIAIWLIIVIMNVANIVLTGLGVN
jgi:metal iron transporter